MVWHTLTAKRQLIRQGKKQSPLTVCSKGSTAHALRATRWTPKMGLPGSSIYEHSADERACPAGFAPSLSTIQLRGSPGSQLIWVGHPDSRPLKLSDYANGLLEALKAHDAARLRSPLTN